MLGLVKSTKIHGNIRRKKGRYAIIELQEEILRDENLDKAIQQFVKNKGTNGVDNMSTMELRDVMASKYREQLKEEIRTRTYKPKPVKRVEIPKATGGKRMLGIPTVIDRMVQRAITQVLTLSISQYQLKHI